MPCRKIVLLLLLFFLLSTIAVFSYYTPKLEIEGPIAPLHWWNYFLVLLFFFFFLWILNAIFHNFSCTEILLEDCCFEGNASSITLFLWVILHINIPTARHMTRQLNVNVFIKDPNIISVRTLQEMAVMTEVYVLKLCFAIRSSWLHPNKLGQMIQSNRCFSNSLMFKFLKNKNKKCWLVRHQIDDLIPFHFN